MTVDVTRNAPDPRDAELRFERVSDAFERAGIASPWSDDPGDDTADSARIVLTVACQRAPYLATLIVRDPARLVRVASDPYLRREKPREVMADELDRILSDCPGDDDDELARRLRHYRADEMVRLGARELEMGNPREVGRELAHLADVCFDGAIGFHDRALRARHGPPRYIDHRGVERDAELVVIGMGKLGGLELNFSSDVDVIYIYSSDNGEAGDLSLHEYFSKLCKRITAALGEVTADDTVFRVDLRLRPEGSQGAIANSLPSTERYYETWGRPWERQAWLKARPCAGSAALGAEVLAILQPFIYPRTVSSKIIDEVTALNRRIKVELDGAGMKQGFDVKNGVGGIREIEFFAQALQLVHGGHNPFVRSRTTLTALSQLLFAGFVPESEHRVLTEAYRYLRRAEHLLQLDSGRQTQRLPAGAESLRVFARRLGHDDSDEFLAVLGDHTQEVARLFATLGGCDEGPSGEIAALLAATLEPDRELAILRTLGFRSPEHAHHELTIARRKPASPVSPNANGAAARVAPDLFAEISASPDPDQALRYISDLIGRRGAWSSIWRLFDQVPATMRLVVSLFGMSSFLAKVFVDNPDLIDVLVDIGRARPTRGAEDLARELDQSLGSIADDDTEAQWSQLARFKNTQVLRIGLADIGGELRPEQVSAELSGLAEVCLERAYRLVERAMVARHGTPRVAETGEPATLVIAALGKLGSGELGYASDLDVIFVYSGDGESDGPRSLDNVTYMTRLAQRLVSGLHAMHPGGRLYELDTRLRPSGAQGLLVSTLTAWRNYHQGTARLWERQALIRLRPVAGDPALGRKVADAAAEYLYGRPPGQGCEDVAAIAEGITSMRDKIERELASDGNDLKAGRGGRIDVEFASQFLQLAYGYDHPLLRTRSTMGSLLRAGELGLADANDCSLLCDGYRFLRKLENRMRIVHNRSVHTLPHDPDELDKLARRAGYPDGDALSADYEHWTREVRAVYGRVLRSR